MENPYRSSRFEFWGGIECTLNRVGDSYFDQLQFTGHYHRPGDIDRLASLGITTMRYPVLWEMHEPEERCDIDWKWAKGNLERLRQHAIKPVVGFVHHGSGPAFTGLEDELFPQRLARYASRVARQFPWLEYYTPVNEPLTTARFSGLYGFWYPHKNNDLTFLRILLNEVRAIVLSMREIRKINSDARLVQTEDLAKTYSGAVLKYQADFENERRWLTFDLLCGRVNRSHPLWDYLLWVGLKEKEIAFFQDNPCIPDIAGFNYYLTSERFLDANLDHYPRHFWGGNHKHRYVDTEAIRIRHHQQSGLELLLGEAWSRFKLPIVITEAFLSCTEQEQVRWLNEVYRSAQASRHNGVDIRGLTFWALLGEFSWNKLVTSMDGEYEPGAFDVMGREPRETLTADFIRSLTGRGTFEPDWMNERGWWEREDRYHLHEVCINS